MGRFFDEWQRQQDSRSLKEELDNLAQLADDIKAKNVTSVYFTNTDDDIRDRLFGDFLGFVVFVWSYTKTIYKDIEEIGLEFKDFISFESNPQLVDLLHSVEDKKFAFKSPLIVCVVDRLCISDGRRGQVIDQFLDIYESAINKLFQKSDRLKRSWTSFCLNYFIKQCDQVADSIVATDTQGAVPVDSYELPSFDPADYQAEEDDDSK